MSVRSLGALARERRSSTPASVPEVVGTVATSGTGLSGLEKAVPSEIIVFYTAVIAACEAAATRDEGSTFTTFRVLIFLAALAVTGYAAGRATAPVVGGWGPATRTSEWWTAVLSFAAWGGALPGSFLYVWLSPDALVVTVSTVTAGATLLIAVVLAPRLQQQASVPTARSGPARPGTGS
jgi:hypothetical protein